ncbi:unnamed protein product [Cuscuta europaea]|uniref:Uncharacterized protein n=1 Tax=Cuscuta europaea TaxID=41803 RepID=A0A9P1EDL9_CUSEU|nr:unnamed protein product [Cuscuta europaea]
MAKQGYTVDLSKPLVFQVGHLGDAYDEWVHQPIVGKEGPRFFENDLLELLTRTPWWAIPTIWLPVVWWLASTSVNRGLSAPQLVATLLVGLAVWTLLEYSLHRFLFHKKPRGYCPCEEVNHLIALVHHDETEVGCAFCMKMALIA